MNVAFSAMLAFVLLIPGLVFLRIRRASSKHAALVMTAPQAFSIEIALAVVISVAIHSFCCMVATLLSGLIPCGRPNVSAALMLLLGHFGPDDELLKETVEAIASHPMPLLAYFAFTIAVAGIAGRLSHEFKKDHPIGACLLDQRELVMEEWANFFNLGANSYALVTAVVDMGGKAYLFLGILKKLHFDPATAELDRIELEQVAKRPIEPREKPRDNGQQQWLWSGAREDAEESIQKYEPVFGNQFMLRMSEIKTLNVVYIDNASWQESTNSN